MMVSIIIVNYNTYHLTKKCIESIYAQTHNCSFQVILVDNASTECDPNIFKKEFPDIDLVINQTNKGFAGGNNDGITKAKGDYILLLNSDTELVNDAISIAVQTMESNLKIGILTGRLIYPDGRTQGVAGSFPSLKNEMMELLRLSKFESAEKKSGRLKGDLWDYTKPTATDWVWGTFFMFNKNMLNLFPDKKLHEDFFMYFEDVLWCYHVHKHTDLLVYYSPEPLIIHHLAGSNMNNMDSIYRTK
ncbi:glycosyltransferase family 2 protein, partial [Flavobacterium sp.]|uniref:glycosyltransferase family 2 protein n=1 Tax=Flavobacterium sp. TaxID=239 RepID=UPI0025B9CFF0